MVFTRKESNMDTMTEIMDRITEFCNSVPAEGFEIPYLEKASDMLKHYKETLFVLDTNGPEKEEELKKILLNIKEI